MTPEYLAKEIIEHFNPTGRILDPCRGEGAFYDNYPGDDNGGVNLVRKDFLQYQKKVDWIITNPPWSKIQQFLAHGMVIADNIVYPHNYQSLHYKRRIRDMREHGFALKEICSNVPTPKESLAQLGFQLAAVHTQRDYKKETLSFLFSITMIYLYT